jgi:hypothetical protein
MSGLERREKKNKSPKAFISFYYLSFSKAKKERETSSVTVYPAGDDRSRRRWKRTFFLLLRRFKERSQEKEPNGHLLR